MTKKEFKESAPILVIINAPGWSDNPGACNVMYFANKSSFPSKLACNWCERMIKDIAENGINGLLERNPTGDCEHKILFRLNTVMNHCPCLKCGF